MRPRAALGIAEAALVAAVFCSSAFFYNGASSNQNARLDAVFAFVQPGTADSGTFRIDRFLPSRNDNTTDWAFVDGHYYANKAPGEILLTTALYAALFHLQALVGVPSSDPRVEIFDAYLINLLGPALLLAFAALAFARMLRRELSERQALLLTVGLCLGTPLFPYSTQLWGHISAAACVGLGIVALRRSNARAMFVAGLAFGWATCTDYLAVIAASLAGVYCIVRHGRASWRYFLGGLVPLGCLLGYQWYCFGNPLTLGVLYSSSRFVETGRTLGMFGVPSPLVWLQILFSPYRGILLHAPILWLGVAGCGYWFVRRRTDPLLWLCVSVFLASTMTVASFNGWHGGATVCTRYLIAFLPFFFLPAKEIPWNRAWSTAAAALGGLSVLNMLTVAAVGPFGIDDPNPLYGFSYRMLFEGQVAFNVGGILLHELRPDWPQIRSFSAWNWGQILGLSGMASLLPLLVAWSLLFWRSWWATRRDDSRGSPLTERTAPP